MEGGLYRRRGRDDRTLPRNRSLNAKRRIGAAQTLHEASGVPVGRELIVERQWIHVAMTEQWRNPIDGPRRLDEALPATLGNVPSKLPEPQYPSVVHHKCSLPPLPLSHRPRHATRSPRRPSSQCTRRRAFALRSPAARHPHARNHARTQPPHVRAHPHPALPDLQEAGAVDGVLAVPAVLLGALPVDRLGRLGGRAPSDSGRCRVRRRAIRRRCRGLTLASARHRLSHRPRGPPQARRQSPARRQRLATAAALPPSAWWPPPHPTAPA